MVSAIYGPGGIHAGEDARPYVDRSSPGELPEVVLTEWMELGSFGFVNAPRRGAFTSLKMTVVSAIYDDSTKQDDTVKLARRIMWPYGRDARAYIDSERLSDYDFAIVDEKLRGALIGAADDRQQAGELLARNQAEGAALRTGQHRPVRVVLFSNTAGILQHKDRAGEHLLRDPFAQEVQFSNHLASFKAAPPGPNNEELNFSAYEACFTLRPERVKDRVTARVPVEALPFFARITARTCRTVSLRQMVSMGWRAFLRMSTICRGEVSR